MTTGTSRLRRSDRLLQSRDFRRVAQQGKRVASDYFVVLVAPGELNGATASDRSGRRLGVTVSRKVGNAVIRNKVKRAIREWFRGERDGLADGVDVVVIARRPAVSLSGREVRSRLNELVSGASTQDAS